VTAKLVRAVSVFSATGSRPFQEDFVVASHEKGIFVVADGFGGPSAGATASKTACEAVRGFLEKEAGDLEATLPFVLRSYFSLAGNVLFNALIHANRKVSALNKDKNVHEKGGASVLAGFLDGDLLALASVGACSAWLMRGGQQTELVTPRTYGRLAEPFRADPAPNARVPLAAIGVAEDLEPEVVEYRVRPGDWLILHTDGLTSEARAELLALQARGLRPSEAAREALAALQRRRTFTDNVATALIAF
jgi:protein phosphatase